MKFLGLFIGILLGYQASACDGILPLNDLWIPINESADEMSSQEFNQILDRFDSLYTPLFKERNATLRIRRLWIDGTVNAFASREGNQWSIHMHGGIARHPNMTKDGFALVTCHEIGHHIGGSPIAGGDSTKTWVTNEGQSDYYGSTKCFRRYALLDNNQELMQNTVVPQTIRSQCNEVFEDKEQQAICYRGALAGISLANVFADITWPKREIDIDSPSRKRVWWTKDTHPAPQCRLDTYFQGSLCTKDYLVAFDDDDPSVGACTRDEGFEVGARPRCWYKP